MVDLLEIRASDRDPNPLHQGDFKILFWAEAIRIDCYVRDGFQVKPLRRPIAINWLRITYAWLPENRTYRTFEYSRQESLKPEVADKVLAYLLEWCQTHLSAADLILGRSMGLQWDIRSSQATVKSSQKVIEEETLKVATEQLKIANYQAMWEKLNGH